MIKRGLPASDLEYVISNSEDVLRTLGGQKILLTGATGFLGSWLAAVLLEANISLNLGLELNIVTRPTAGSIDFRFSMPNDTLKMIPIDLFSNIPIKNPLLKGFDLIFHFAISSNDKFDFVDKGRNKKCLDLLTQALHSSRSVFFLPSSGAAYGNQPIGLERIPENFDFQKQVGVITEYGKMKLELEERLKEMHQDLIGISPRLFTFFGPGLPTNKHFAIGNFISDGLSGKNIKVKGNPKTTRSFLYVADAIIWILQSLQIKEYESLHIGSREIIGIEELAKVFSQRFNCEIEFTKISGNSYPNNYVPENLKTKKTLGIKSEIDLKTGIENWILWLQSF